ncbi:acetyl-CoA carboxylase carboxyl transferase subunit alpha/beta [Corynebacterium diphtheriae]|nr:acetyl-CoA carboxylase carboxyl transferase subunit alpha/beta [Corynebacterium diphtheriae]
MLPADKVLATSHAWLSPLPPEGASAIIYRDTSHAAQMMEEQQVSAVTLKEVGIIDAIIDEPVAAHQHPDAFATCVLEKVTAALAELDDSPAVGRESRLQRYEKLAHTLI